MLVQSIRAARNAAKQVQITKAALRNACGVRSRSDFCPSRSGGGQTDPIATVVYIRDKLRAQLKQEEVIAAEKHARMVEMLNKVPAPATRAVFYYRYYCGAKWDAAARKAGLSCSAAKMRCQCYLEQEVTQDAA